MTKKWPKVIVSGFLVLMTLLPLTSAGAQEGPEPETDSARRRYVAFNTAASDRGWNASFGGDILFYDANRRIKVFGSGQVNNSDERVILAIRQNINRTTNDGRWYGLCYDSEGDNNTPCDRYLDFDRSASGTSYLNISDDDNGEYFAFGRTIPGRGLRGVWIRVCHSVDGPDACGRRTYVDNPYVPGRNP